MVIGSSLLLSGDDWVAVRVYLDDLYGLNDSIPLDSPDQLCQWCSKHRELGNLTSHKDVDKYYWDFTALSTDLAPNKMLANEVHLCFYRGIPVLLCSKIILATNLKTSLPPMTATLINLLRTEFDDEELDAKTTYVGVDLDSESDSSSSESDEDINKVVLTKKKKKPVKKVTFEKTVPAAPIVKPVDLNPVDHLTKQMEDLRLSHAEFLRSVNIAPNPNLTNQQIMREARCFFCNKTTH